MLKNALLIVCLFCGVTSWAQGLWDGHLATHLAADEGLTNCFVRSIVIDKTHLPNFATFGGGVLRYDGYQFTRVLPGTSNFVRAQAVDVYGRLWIGNENGLCPPEGWDRGLPRPDSFPRGVVSALCPFGSDWMLACVGQNIVALPQRDASLKSDYTPSLLDSDNGLLTADSLRAFVGCNGKISQVRLDNQGVPWLTPLNVNSLADGSVLEALLLEADTLWIGTDRGLVKHILNADGDVVFRHSDTDPYTLSQDRTTCLAVSRTTGRLLIGTLGGLSVLDRGSGKMHRFLAGEAGSRRCLASNFVNALCPTERGLWIGYDGQGLDYIAPIDMAMTATTKEALFGQNCANGPHPVNAILPTERNLYVGGSEAGLAIRDNDTKQWHRMTTANGLPHNSVSCLAAAQGNLYIGSWGGGLAIAPVDETTGAVGRPSRVTLPCGDFLGALVHDSINGGVWVGAIDGILFLANDGRVLRPVAPDITAGMNGALGADIDNQGRLWMGISTGLVIIDLHTLQQHDTNSSVQAHIYQHSIGNARIPVVPRVTFLRWSNLRNAMMVCTNGEGFYLVPEEPGGYGIVHYTTAEGLSNDCAVGVAEEPSGDLWIATTYGLNRLTCQPEALNAYTRADGLLDNCYFWNAAANDDSGVYFGAMGGLTFIANSQQKYATYLTTYHAELREPIVTALQSGDSTFYHNPESLQTLTLRHDAGPLRVYLSSECFEAPGAVRFRVHMEGLDDDWVELPRGQHIALYPQVASGTHRLHLQYITTDGLLSPERIIQVNVSAPFYRSWWFTLLVALAALAAVWGIVLLRTRSIRRSRELLRTEVAQRTAEIATQNERLAAQTAELQHQNEALVMQKQEMLVLSERIQRLTADKLQFFTNVSHELRSPLTLILGPVKHARQKIAELQKARSLGQSTAAAEAEKASERGDGGEVLGQLDGMLAIVETSATGMLETVAQLLDFRKADTLSLELHPVADDLAAFVQRTVIPYVAYAADKHFQLTLYQRLSRPNWRFDHDALSKLIVNLLSNALKYGRQGSIDFYCATVSIDGREQVYLSCSDEGPGVPESQLQSIFEKFQSASTHSINGPANGVESSGLGLYLVKSLVVQMGGEVSARNNRPNGLSIRILLPLSRAHEGLPETGTSTNAGDKEGGADSDALLKAEATNNEEGHRPTVLVVDDNGDMRQFIRTVLQGAYAIIEAPDGLDALRRLREASIDLVLTDLMMPGLDGLELARRIKADKTMSHIPVVILTASASDDFQTTGYRVGVESYMHKPFDEAMLRARIEGILNSRREAQRKYQLSLDPGDLNIERKTADAEFAEALTNVIKQRYGDAELRIEDLVAATGCSKSLLHKKTQCLMGTTPGDLLRTYRLNVARELLAAKTNDLTVKQVAFECGFNDPRYFARCFQQAFGISPSEVGLR